MRGYRICHVVRLTVRCMDGWDAPECKPGRPQRCDTTDVIIGVVDRRERGCAKYDGGHAGKVSVGGPKVGRLEGDISPDDMRNQAVD